MSKQENAIKETRRLYVVKANDLIRKTRYNLTAQQQKIVLFCISKIRPNDPPGTAYEIDIRELCEACNLDVDIGGMYYKTIKTDLINLTQRYWVELPDKTLVTVSWIGDAEIIPYSSKVIIHFHPKMAPYLFQLKERYTQYRLEDVLPFKGKHAIRLYEILRSYVTAAEIEEGYQKRVTISLADLKHSMGIDNYDRWINFERRVILSSVNEINSFSQDMQITYEPMKDGGRSIEKILFTLSSPRAKQILTARANKRQRLEGQRTKKKTAAPSGEQVRMDGLEDDSKRE